MAQSSKSPAEIAQQSVADLTIQALAHDERRLAHVLGIYQDLARAAMAAHAEEKQKRKWYQREYFRLRDAQQWPRRVREEVAR